MKITLSKSQWQMIGKKAGWKVAQTQPQEQQINTKYLTLGLQKASEYLKYHSETILKIIAALIQKNPNANWQDIKNELLTLDRMEDEEANAIVKLIQKSMSE